jgi:hypothetical protein
MPGDNNMIDFRTHPVLIQELAKKYPDYERSSREVFQIGNNFQPLCVTTRAPTLGDINHSAGMASGFMMMNWKARFGSSRPRHGNSSLSSVMVIASDLRDVSGCVDAGYPRPTGVRQAMLFLPPGTRMAGLKPKAGLEVKGMRHPVGWACAQKTNTDGSLALRRNLRS